MINYFKQRKLRKQIKEYLHMARHARHMREDIAEPADLASLDAAVDVVREIRRTGEGNLEKAFGILEEASNRVYPTHHTRGMRENVEVVIVALGAAMAIRAFFLEPFKIPTGSMQPTLNGITVEAQAAPGLLDNPVTKFPKWLLTGESYKEIKAKVSGPVTPMRNQYGRLVPYVVDRDKVLVSIGGTVHKIPSYMGSEFRLKDYYKKGDVIVSAKVIAGDHILVNKMKYNFMRPERGDISVFDTRNISHPDVREGTFYIKRMVGLPGEKMQIQDGRIVADGQIVSDPPMFDKIATDEAYNGGHGNAGQLSGPDAFIQLGDDEYLMCGDNTKPNMSLDGRFFGGVPRGDFKGPAMFVYWPPREHWGVVR